MADIVDRKTRSRMMAGIRGKNTSPEIAVRKGLHRRGFRFRLHVKRLPGSPDIVLPRWKCAVFVSGCFWHQHDGCKYASTPKSNTTFWSEKLARNVSRDAEKVEKLRKLGWRVATVWECSFRKNNAQSVRPIEKLERWIRGNRKIAVIPVTPPELRIRNADGRLE